MADLLVEMTGINESFPGVNALEDARFDPRSGEVHALVGENGAGKSTLMKILAGIHHRDAETIRVKGQEVGVPSPKAAQVLGIAIIHQELNLMGHLSVAEDIFIGRELRRRVRFGLVEAGAITRNPVGIGARRVDAALDVIAGRTLPKSIDTGYHWYDKTNINNPEIQAVLYK
jgi:ribose transport system ATP-binding protein